MGASNAKKSNNAYRGSFGDFVSGEVDGTSKSNSVTGCLSRARR